IEMESNVDVDFGHGDEFSLDPNINQDSEIDDNVDVDVEIRDDLDADVDVEIASLADALSKAVIYASETNDSTELDVLPHAWAAPDADHAIIVDLGSIDV